MNLHHPYTVVKISNKRQLAYFLAWADETGRKCLNAFRIWEEFPLFLGTSGDIVGWTDRTDRNLKYESFADFVACVEEEK